MASTKDVRQFIRKLEKYGLYCKLAPRSGHYHILRKEDDTFVTSMPYSPSDYRWQKNARSQLRRMGYFID